MKKIRNQAVELELLQQKRVELFVKREDEIHPFISGNKYRKLKYNLKQAEKEGANSLLSFGGAYSNHISALSFAGKEYGFKTLGVIRGDELDNNLNDLLASNSTLKFAHDNGMRFKFVSRSRYRNKMEGAFIDELREEFGNFYLVPEGGTNQLAVKGCAEILKEEDAQFDYICVAVGTGGTISGLINSALKHQQVFGFPSLKGDFLRDEIEKYTIPDKNWSLINEYHFGGYAKINENLISFINQFNQQTTIPLDPVYTGKMMFGIMDMVKNDFFKENSRILAIHTGGLQGIQGMNERLLKRKLPLIHI